ncbi:uncharacterized protein LOC129602493 isoform X1 [Paramacrobiotus metropolitanus]|uniref:uncharacterized protein LOC129602493 isoform X1 n=1 Tax=Paramacrobiotus metropolitanus TaxID=2943436 RepID=UPI002445EBFF|nr:uncharacterized protein LOC129602493 isoform X1 [Paramacrobiotus metropolitanus]
MLSVLPEQKIEVTENASRINGGTGNSTTWIRPSLGRAAGLAELYDAYHGTFLGISIMKDVIPSPCRNITSTTHSDIEIVISDTLEEKFDKFDIRGDLKLGVACNLVSVSGCGKFLYEEKQTSQTAKATLLFQIRTVEESLNLSHTALKDVISERAMLSPQATHIVAKVGWGAYAAVTLETVVSKNENVKDVEGQLEGMVTGLKKSIGAGGNIELDKSNFRDIKTVSFKMYGDVDFPADVAVSLESIQTFMQTLPALAKSVNDGKGVPVSYTLVPVHICCQVLGVTAEKSRLVREIDDGSVSALIDLLDEISSSRQQLSQLIREIAAHKQCIDMVYYHATVQRRKELLAAEQKLKSDIKSTLVSVRLGEQPVEQLEELRKSFEEGAQSPSAISFFISKFEFLKQKMSIMDFLQHEGVTIVGHKESLTDVLMEKGARKDVYVLYYREVFRFGSRHEWGRSWDVFHRYLDEEKDKDTLFICVDCDTYLDKLWPDEPTVALYRGSVCAITNLVAEENHLTRECIARAAYIEPSRKPNKRCLVELPCPNSVRPGRCLNHIRRWICERCKGHLEYGFDDHLYCSCGKAGAKDFAFRCDQMVHGPNARSFLPDHESYLREHLSRLRTMKETNILILGETGVGKSTWINGIINYLTYGELGDAKKGKLKCWIPFEFMKTSSNFDQTKVRMEANIGNTGTEDEFVAENVGVDGSSVTQEPRSFAFPYGDGIIRLIDTPGVGDTRGYEQDRLNFGKVLGHIAFLSEIHGICILLKPNNSRLTVTFQFCINELLTHLHKDAAENIIFVFTNSRSTSYLPGDTLPPLKTLLQNKPDLSIHLSLHTMYCMDNEAVRFLAAAENGISFTEKEEEDFAESWKTSVGETRRLLDHIFSLPPHNTRNTVTLNEARRLVLQFTEPLGKISTLLENNVELIKSKREDLQRQIADKTVLEKDLYVPVQRLHVKSSSVPRTVCAAAKCIEVLRDENGETKINYKTVCHENCTLKEVPPEVATQDKLRRCNAMRWFTQNCSRCGCNYKEHMHIHYECFKKDEKVVDVSVRSLLDAQSGIIRAAEETLKRLEEAEKELLREKKIITRASSKFACFLKAKSMVPYNDALEDYLDFLIKKAEQSLGLLKDGATDSDRKRLAACKRMRESYKEERDLMERARSQGATDADITAEGMRKEIEQLYALKNFGQNFRDMVRFENTNELDRSRYRETLHGAECNFSKKPNSLQKRAKQEYKALKNKGKETMKSLHLLPGSRH